MSLAFPFFSSPGSISLQYWKFKLMFPVYWLLSRERIAFAEMEQFRHLEQRYGVDLGAVHENQKACAFSLSTLVCR